MEKITIKCDVCGTTESSYLTNIRDNVYKCEACDSIFFYIENSETQHKLYSAETHISTYDFERAETLYNEILSTATIPQLKATCYYGKLRAQFGIIHLKSYETGRVTPTIAKYDPEITSIKNSEHYKNLKAVDLPEDIRKDYEKKIDQLDKSYQLIEQELKKTPEYDVFICVKISRKTDEEPKADGTTDDAKSAENIYNDLTKQGYKVFYSPEKYTKILDDSQIMSALLRSKTLLVIGSTEKYLSSRWVQSEWRRWNDLIGRKKKEKDSIILLKTSRSTTVPGALVKAAGRQYTLSLGESSKAYEVLAEKEKSSATKKESTKPVIVEEIKKDEVVEASAIKKESTITRLKKETPIEDFEIENGVLKKYKGKDSEVIIPEGVTSIGDDAFSCCSHLTSVTISNSVTSIGGNAFSYCDNLTSIIIPNSVTNVGSYAFFGCGSLTSIEIPNSVTSIGENAFFYCDNLSSIVIPDSVTSIGSDAFSCCYRLVEVYNLSNLDIRAGSSDNGWVGHYAKVIHTSEEKSRLIKKNDYVFIKDYDDKYYLVSYKGTKTELVLPSDIEGYNYEINNYAFFECSRLISITIPNSVTSIGNSAFFECSRLTSITIPNSVTYIGNYAFWGCDNLTSVTIGNSVTRIGNWAFSDCRRLVEVYNLSNLDIRAGSSDNGWVGHYAKVIHTSEEKSRLIKKNDYVFIKDYDDKYYLVSYEGKETKLVLPNDIEGHNYEINTGAFYKCSDLTSIVIPKVVTSIGKNAFSECSSLTSITIPSSVIKIEEGAFYYCVNLEDVKIERGISSIGNDAFWGCKNLTSITIPSSVRSIGEKAFDKCNKYLSIFYRGTKEDGKKLFSDTSNVYYYSDIVRFSEEGNYWHYVDGIPTKY